MSASLWISPENEALQAQSVAMIALVISFFGFAWKRNRLWFSLICLTATALLIAAIVVVNLGT
jgi:hypothetical protein